VVHILRSTEPIYGGRKMFIIIPDLEPTLQDRHHYVPPIGDIQEQVHLQSSIDLVRNRNSGGLSHSSHRYNQNEAIKKGK
jgi:hypothetical protein